MSKSHIIEGGFFMKGKNFPESLRLVQERLQAASFGRVPDLVAVSKGVEQKVLHPFLEAGHKIFGENRVQEAARKWPPLKKKYCDVRLHLVGALQTNKVKAAVKLFDVIETVDRVKLALALRGAAVRLFVQVNTGQEPQKAGVAPQNLENFVSFCRSESLEIEGLMCLPPKNEDPRKHFVLLAQLARAVGLGGLSMGMSEDYEEATKLGATQVRVGRALFGGLTGAPENFMKG